MSSWEEIRQALLPSQWHFPVLTLQILRRRGPGRGVPPQAFVLAAASPWSALRTKTMRAASSVPAHGGPKGPLSDFSPVGKTLLILTTQLQRHLYFLAQQTFTNYQPCAKHCAQPPPRRPHHLVRESAEEHTGVAEQSSGDSKGSQSCLEWAWAGSESMRR